MNNREALRIIGAGTSNKPFGRTGKMPGFSYGLDATKCQRGSMLASNPESMCHPDNCYAKRNFYATWTPVVVNRQRHTEAVHHPQWADAMVHLLFAKAKDERWFRWHDSGDLQGVEHFEKICEVARRTTWLSHWLPTHEPGMVATAIALRGPEIIPPNLTVRISADLIGQAQPWAPWVNHLPTSTVNRVAGSPVQVSDSRKDSVECRAYERDHKCGTCRACWSPLVRNVSYPLTDDHGKVDTRQRPAALRVVNG